ncbi:MAG TPA: FadR/GntR family transcriptional regulator [Steroidobacteraceae bacterium]|nr:FadR/GntR family transcriptional regulator [Steroidobacteraceae bacterium]
MAAQANYRPIRPSAPRPMPRLSRLALERAKSSHDQIAAILGTELLKGVYAPGSNMPAEPELIERFQISRTVMREVMKTLAAKGFVVSKTKVGTRVREPVYWNYFDADVLAWRVRLGLDDEFMKSLTEVRRALEPAAAALAAQRRSPTDIGQLRECVRQMARTDHTRQSFAEADLDFHLAIGNASGNPLMRSMASVIETALVASFAHSSPVDDPQDHEATVNGHAAIVDAIESGEEQAAAAAILRVINIGVNRIDVTRKKQRGQAKK